MNILVPYKTCKLLLKYLSAYNVAKLNLSLNFILDKTERQIYLNLMRNLFQNVPKINTLLQEGIKLMLLRKDIQHLKQRLNNLELFLKIFRHKRRLQIYIIKSFLLQGITLAEVLKSLIKFSVNRRPYKSRIVRDNLNLQDISKNY